VSTFETGADMIFKYVLLIIFCKLLAEIILELLNRTHIKKCAQSIPQKIADLIDKDVFNKSIPYILEKNKFSITETIFDTAVLAVLLISFIFPAVFGYSYSFFTNSPIAAQIMALLLSAFIMQIPGIPFSYYMQFHIEQRYGFNKSSIGLWISDFVKGAVLSVVLVSVLGGAVLKLVHIFPDNWWLLAFAFTVLFQILLLILYPRVIMPLFNKFTPLAEGPVKERLLSLARQCNFPASGIFVMDGSKRSGHSNAFFTGFGKFRRIVLFDTLIEQLSTEELAAVLAHEIGHYKMGHVVRRLIQSVVFMGISFRVIFYLSLEEWFVQSFGFSFSRSMPAASFFCFSILASGLMFFFTPIQGFFSRRHEYAADQYARKAMGDPEPLVQALRKLNEKNLSNPCPHPLYSGFYYSHPVLTERTSALRT